MGTDAIRAWRLLAVVLAASFCLRASLVRAEDAATRANRMAYDSAIRCFIADGIVAGDMRRKGDGARQASFEAKARESFDIALKAGEALGYTGTRINEDFGLAQSGDASRLINDTGYFKSVAAECKSLGLM